MYPSTAFDDDISINRSIYDVEPIVYCYQAPERNSYGLALGLPIDISIKLIKVPQVLIWIMSECILWACIPLLRL